MGHVSQMLLFDMNLLFLLLMFCKCIFKLIKCYSYSFILVYFQILFFHAIGNTVWIQFSVYFDFEFFRPWSFKDLDDFYLCFSWCSSFKDSCFIQKALSAHCILLQLILYARGIYLVHCTIIFNYRDVLLPLVYFCPLKRCHVKLFNYVFLLCIKSESTLCNCLNVKELLA